MHSTLVKGRAPSWDSLLASVAIPDGHEIT